MEGKYKQLNIKDESQRLVEGWASVQIKDKDGELIPIEELENIMPILMDRGGLVMFKHSNKPVGKILKWEVAEHPETGKKGIKLLVKIFNHYKLDDMVWQWIKEGKIKGFSFGGASGKEEYLPWRKGEDIVRVLKDIEGYEFSLVENPANPYATIEAINWKAKGDEKGKENVEKSWKCPICGKLFDSMRKLLLHIAGEHPREAEEQILLGDVRKSLTLDEFISIIIENWNDRMERVFGSKREFEREADYWYDEWRRWARSRGYPETEDTLEDWITLELTRKGEKEKEANEGLDKAVSEVVSFLNSLPAEDREFLLDYIETEAEVLEKEEILKPFAGFKNFDDCLRKMKEQGYDEESAKRICGKLYWKYERGRE